MPRLIDFQPDDLMPSTTWLEHNDPPDYRHTGMVNLSHFRDADQNSFGADEGGAHRFAAVIHTLKPVAVNADYVMDSAVDWRDRIALITWIRVSSDDGGTHPIKQAYFPGGPDDDLFCTDAVFGSSDIVDFDATVAYFGSGTDTYIVELTDGIRIYCTADHLVLRITTSATFDRNSLLIMISATEQLGKRTTPPSMPSIPLNFDGAEVVPLELNALQDATIMSQVSADPDGDALDEEVLAFGPATRGDPNTSQLWQIQNQDGVLEHDGEKYFRPTFERRQMVSGSVRKFFAISAGASATVIIDSEHDWRDRLIALKGRRNATDIRPGESTDTSHNSATGLNRMGYTGSGSSGTTGYSIYTGNGWLYADSSTGALKFYNSQGATEYLTGMIMASFQLGVRKPTG